MPTVARPGRWERLLRLVPEVPALDVLLEDTSRQFDKGWFLPYAVPSERTGSAATVINGCVHWSSFDPNPSSTAVCASAGTHASRLYQANFLSGTASCAQGFYTPATDTWARFLGFSTHTSLATPTPQRVEFNGQVHTSATLSTPLSTASAENPGGPFLSLPVSVSAP